MPRDCLPPAAAELALPGHRKARVVPADDAGQVRLVIQDGTPIDRMLRLGWLDRGEHAAAAALLLQFEASGLRQRMGGSYTGAVIDHSSTDCAFETMDAAQLAAWRKLGKLLNQIPPQFRTQCSMVCCWGHAPWDAASLRRGLGVLARRLQRGRG